MTKKKTVSASGGMELYLKRVFAMMFGAVGLTAVACWFMIYAGGITLFITSAGAVSPLYYIVLFGAFGLSIWAQTRVFSMKPQTGALLLAIYAILIGFVLTPLILFSLSVNPASILQAFIISALMFGCMATFGYKTVKDLSFLKTFLFIGMIGLILVGIASIFWPLGGVFSTIVCLAGVLIFALFTAYDMQSLKRAYAETQGDVQRNQLAVLGALHLYISFIAMFQYILSLLNLRR